MHKDITQDSQSWWLRFIKGMFVGSGFIIPGVSGGALAAIFGIYERIIRFLSNLTDHFWENVKFFIPVGIGALFSISLLSWGVSFLLGQYETVTLWFFVGAIIGTLPALFREAGEEGRSSKDYVILVVSFIFGVIFLAFGNRLFDGGVQASFLIWMVCGGLIALGVLVPGLSPSNFIVYMGLYEAMADGFKLLDLSILIPIALGGLLVVILLSKIIARIFDRHYSALFHFIVGIVLASTLIIVPTDYTGFTLKGYLLCVLSALLGIGIGHWMANLEERYK